jgi:hypothetical protein
MSGNIVKSVVIVSLLIVGSALTSCSSGKAEPSSDKVQGHIYQDNGAVVVVEFKSNGKAFVSTGPVSTPCTYSQSGSNVTLICEKDKTNFTVDPDDGALIGPPDGFLGRLKRKQ